MPRRFYRLVTEDGQPHPVLDDLYDSHESAWNDALQWWQEQGAGVGLPAIGVEVSTTSGAWRTLRSPGG